jgi:hypothetical protein
MRKFNLVALLVVLALAVQAQSLWAGPPLVNLEGVGGIAFNPLAYPADSTGDNTHLTSDKTDIIGEPRFGSWYVNLHQKSIDWAAIGAADTLFKRLEVSYGYEAVAVAGTANVHKSNLGAKLLLLPENAFGTKAVPAVSVGIIHKSASGVAGNSKYEVGDLVAGWFGPNVKSEGNDFYVVATKLIPQLPRPVLLSAGLLATDGYATGVLGFDDKHKGTGFGNVDIVWPLGFTTGFEYQQGAKFSDYKNPNYWDLHLAWFATPNITAVLAYVNAGDVKSTDYFGLGEGTVLSLQHTF